MSRLLLLLGLSGLVACSSPASTSQTEFSGPGSDAAPVAEASSASDAAKTTDVSPSGSLSDEHETALSSADAADGKADQVVEKCAGCSLLMSGKAEHSLSAGDYTLHLCNAACKTRFAADLEGSLDSLAKLEPTPPSGGH